MTQARFTREARAELLAQTAYYETIRRGLGARFRSEVEETVQRAATFPTHGKPGPAKSRLRVVAGFPFKIVYTTANDGIIIHAVASDHRLPEYWLRRMPRAGP